jgi:hypothetical protein
MNAHSALVCFAVSLLKVFERPPCLYNELMLVLESDTQFYRWVHIVCVCVFLP